eukprot:3340878-Amphidinium_carterae.1
MKHLSTLLEKLEIKTCRLASVPVEIKTCRLASVLSLSTSDERFMQRSDLSTGKFLGANSAQI